MHLAAMKNPAHYSELEVAPRLLFLDGWTFQRNGIEARFSFRDFRDAFAFMLKVAMEAEKQDHHPDWSQRGNVVEIRLTTHSQGGVTDKDLNLAEKINIIYRR